MVTGDGGLRTGWHYCQRHVAGAGGQALKPGFAGAGASLVQGRVGGVF